jgi:hypothetical protein
MTPFPQLPEPNRISDILRRLRDTAAHGDTVSVGHILHIFGMRGFAFLLLTLALLNIVIFMVPFVSLLFGLPMVILAAQMVLGVQTPIFPSALRHRTVPAAALTRGLSVAIEGLEKIERYIKPRLGFLSAPELYRVHGFVAMVLAVMVTLPIPVVNVPPSIALALLGIGMLQRDGYFVIGAYAIGWWCLVLFRSLSHIAHVLTQ